jgi:hypothetical protein
MAQRLPRGEEEQARYFPAPGEGRDRELHGGDGEVHARAPVAGSGYDQDSGNGWRSRVGWAPFGSELSYEPMHGHAHARKLGRSRAKTEGLVVPTV